MIDCKCGFSSEAGKFAAHAKMCETYKEEKNKLTNIDPVYVAGLYKQNYSVTECIIILQEEFILGHVVIRKIITQILKEQNVYEGIGGKNTQRKKQEKIKATMLKKHGVVNAGQMPGNGWGSRNKIPYKSPSFFTKYKEFSKQVVQQTRKNVSKLTAPTYCEYTGIKFADEILDQSNPNDPCKRTVDHVVSVYECYFNGWTVDQTASNANLIFCIRLCNTIKGNDNVEHFRLNIAKHIREEFINEGYEHNEIIA